jgi:hypothetical protein
MDVGAQTGRRCVYGIPGASSHARCICAIALASRGFLSETDATNGPTTYEQTGCFFAFSLPKRGEIVTLHKKATWSDR